jgi:hypothetical protein
MVVEVLHSLLVSLIGTVFSVLVPLSVAQIRSKRTIYIVTTIFFVAFFILSFYFKLPELILGLM